MTYFQFLFEFMSVMAEFARIGVEWVAALAWPVSVVAVVWLLRSHLSRLLDRIEEVRWRDLVIRLRKDIARAQPPELVPELPPGLDAAVARSPERTLLTAWKSLEDDLRKLAAKRTKRVPRTYRGLGMFLQNQHLVGDELMDRVSALRSAYRVARRGVPLEEDDAADFVVAAHAARVEVAQLLTGARGQGAPND